jgi:hypothetical protein
LGQLQASADDRPVTSSGISSRSEALPGNPYVRSSAPTKQGWSLAASIPRPEPDNDGKMTPVKQFNRWSCVFACVESFLVDNGKTFSHEAVVKDPERRIIDSEGHCGACEILWDFNPGWPEVLAHRGLTPEERTQLSRRNDRVKASAAIRRVLELTRPQELSWLRMDPQGLREVACRFGFHVRIPQPLIHPQIDPEVFPSLPRGETYLLLTANFGNQGAIHCMRSDRVISGERVIVMDPTEGKERDYLCSQIFEWKTFFIRLNVLGNSGNMPPISR